MPVCSASLVTARKPIAKCRFCAAAIFINIVQKSQQKLHAFRGFIRKQKFEVSTLIGLRPVC